MKDLDRTVLAFQEEDGPVTSVTIMAADRIRAHRRLAADGLNLNVISVWEWEARQAFEAGIRKGFVDVDTDFMEWAETVLVDEAEDAEGEATATPDS